MADARSGRARVAIVHDYLTQRGGAERVALAMCQTFPGATLYTSIFRPQGTFPEFADVDIRTSPLNHLALLRRDHRLALPVLAPVFSALRIDAEVVLCSSSGWAHGVRASGIKVVYCHTPARWLYQGGKYLGEHGGSVPKLALKLLAPPLRRWDRAAADSVATFIANSTVVQQRVRTLYGRDAEVIPPPHSMDPGGAREAISGVDPGFVLCVSRFLPYKNLDAVIAAAQRAAVRLVLVGAGPEEGRLRALAGPETRILQAVTEAQLRWLYASCRGLVAAAYEDFGLSPLEAAAFGKPAAVLHWGGYLDTVVAGKTGVFFERPEARMIAAAITELRGSAWNTAMIAAHAERFSLGRFAERLKQVVRDCADQ